MPVYLRNFYYDKLLEVKKTESDSIEKARRKHNSSTPKRPSTNPRFKR